MAILWRFPRSDFRSIGDHGSPRGRHSALPPAGTESNRTCRTLDCHKCTGHDANRYGRAPKGTRPTGYDRTNYRFRAQYEAGAGKEQLSMPTTADEIAKCYRERIERCERLQHLHQPRTTSGSCDYCIRWEVELLVMGFDPKTGLRPEWRHRA